MTEILKNSNVPDFWLYADLRQIIIFESSLVKIIKLLLSLENVSEEKSISDIIYGIRNVSYSIQILQRNRLLELLIVKVGENIFNQENELRIRSILVFIYCLCIYGYRDFNKITKEMNEVSQSIEMIEQNILNKVSTQIDKTESSNRFYVFAATIVNQIQNWLEWNGFAIKKHGLLKNSTFKNKDHILKSLLYLNKKLSKPLEKISIVSSFSFDYILISSFYGFMKRKALKQNFVSTSRTLIKRTLESDESSSINQKSTRYEFSLEDFNNILQSNNFQLIDNNIQNFVASFNSSTSESFQHEIIDLLKLTPEVFARSQKYLFTEENPDKLIIEKIYVNLLKLWNISVKSKWVKNIYLDLYFCPILSLDVKDSVNCKPIIKEILQLVMNFHAVMRLKILDNPFFIIELLVICLEGALYQSTINLNLSPSELIGMSDLISEIGKIFEILLRPQDKENWSRIIIVVLERLFGFLAPLENPVHPDIIRTLKKTVISPIMQITNKYAVKHMKVLVKGAVKEVCKDLLEIK